MELKLEFSLYWAEKILKNLGSNYEIIKSGKTILISNIDKNNKSILNYYDSTRKQITNMLKNVANDDGYGYNLALVFDKIDTYYQYISEYFSADQINALSGGICIFYGYSHLAMPRNDIFQM